MNNTHGSVSEKARKEAKNSKVNKNCRENRKILRGTNAGF
jgi:hypothetical protein